MAKVALIGLEQAAAGQICSALAEANHQIIRYQEQDVLIRELLDVDLVFAGGEPPDYLSLLKRVRSVQPMLPFFVVTRIPQTIEWLDTLEAGATDYCSAPIEMRQLQWMMERAHPRPRFAAARTVSHPAQGISTDDKLIRIWVVNDDAGDVNMFRRALHRTGLNFDLLAMRDGAEARALIRPKETSGGASAPDLVVLDSSLPGADGIEILEAMRQRNVPVLITSCLISPAERARTVEELFQMIAAVKGVLPGVSGKLRTRNAVRIADL